VKYFSFSILITAFNTKITAVSIDNAKGGMVIVNGYNENPFDIAG